MKKAKRLLAVLLAAVMIFSVAAVPSYAYKAESDNWHVPKVNELGKYYFTYDPRMEYCVLWFCNSAYNLVFRHSKCIERVMSLLL